MEREKIAVIGAGVSGLTAAHLLSRRHRVTLFEAADRLGGHAHTHTVAGAHGDLRIDSGFIVMNERTYPELLKLFADLGVTTQPTEMSMSIDCAECGLSYAGGRGLRGIAAQPRRLADPRFLRLLVQVPRFHRRARRLLAGTEDPTWGEFLDEGGFDPYFRAHFAVPLVSCVWSCGEEDAAAYPARHLFAFLQHHGMLQVTGSPTWRTVVGGSRSYVDAVAAGLTDIRRGRPVTSVLRHEGGVNLTHAGGVEHFDRVVLAVPADQALAMLADADIEEKRNLAAIGYSTNDTVLHHDERLLPRARGARAAWNHRLDACSPAGRGAETDTVGVSYWMNLLQGLEDDREHLVTLNGSDRIDPSRVTARMQYRHPIFTREAVAAAEHLRSGGGDRLAFAGAHLGWGFHEDGARSGVAAAAKFGAGW